MKAGRGATSAPVSASVALAPPSHEKRGTADKTMRMDAATDDVHVKAEQVRAHKREKWQGDVATEHKSQEIEKEEENESEREEGNDKERVKEVRSSSHLARSTRTDRRAAVILPEAMDIDVQNAARGEKDQNSGDHADFIASDEEEGIARIDLGVGEHAGKIVDLVEERQVILNPFSRRYCLALMSRWY